MAFFAALFALFFAIVKGILGVLGFTSVGIKAGSLAAMIQSLIGNVVAKSLFAILQSAGMGGYGAAITLQFAKDRPVSAACISVGALAIAAPALAAAPVLAAFGFKTSGIASSSIAAGAQKGIGSVIAPSVFSTLQSAGAGGYGVAPVYGAVQGAGAALGVGGLSGFFEGRRVIKKYKGNNKKSRSDGMKESPKFKARL
ncbi:Interferon-induced 6-16 [Fusarium albosuccineum]|uniref:Interferon-induced 6-16 n=1 Tax=Fusarium albosuccineum TaxID=1237068 RepID=A0A8H4LC98_9HYPO|nr:Interferon-induced 6-16 [Fusarium albosuccineum]